LEPAVNIWDERYATGEYYYGLEPNEWLAACAAQFRPGGRVLSLGEGEGRNAAWLAARGHSVLGVDGSAVAVEKARRLAAERGLPFQMEVADLSTFEPEQAAWDAVILIFVHLPPALRQLVHARAQAALVPGGVLVIEAFTPGQLAFTSGGPRDRDLLYAPDVLLADFSGIAWDTFEAALIDLHEGAHHEGRAAVVRGLGRRAA
jgi:SAM-dependent methyltransferase